MRSRRSARLRLSEHGGRPAPAARGRRALRLTKLATPRPCCSTTSGSSRTPGSRLAATLADHLAANGCAGPGSPDTCVDSVIMADWLDPRRSPPCSLARLRCRPLLGPPIWLSTYTVLGATAVWYLQSPSSWRATPCGPHLYGPGRRAGRNPLSFRASGKPRVRRLCYSRTVRRASTRTAPVGTYRCRSARTPAPAPACCRCCPGLTWSPYR